MIEDDPDIVELLQDKLEREGYRVLTAVDGGIGLSEARRRKLAAILLDLLLLARIEEQSHDLSLEPVDLGRGDEHALEIHGESAADKDISLDTAVEGGAGLVLADHESLVQVLDNLIDNAIKYTCTGGQITIRVFSVGERSMLAVTDPEVGISPEDLDRIFERFYGVDKARSREVGGTGLGLSIVRHLVVAMKGDVNVEIDRQRGSTFRVLLQSATVESAG